MDVVVEVDLALGGEVFSIGLEEHHAAPFVHDSSLGHETKLLVRDRVAVGWNHATWILDHFSELLLVLVPLLDILLLNFGFLSEQGLEVSVLLPLDGEGSRLVSQLLVVLTELFVLKQLQLLVIVPD